MYPSIKRILVIFFCLSLLCSLVGCAFPVPKLPTAQQSTGGPVEAPVEAEGEQDGVGVEVPTRDIAYGDQAENLLDVYLPAGAGPFPVLLLIHGTDMSKSYFVDTMTTADLIENGYAAVAIGYRAPTLEVPLAPLQDIACALAWTYENSAQYSFDAQNIVLFGHSRGATLAALISSLNDLQPSLEGCDYTLPPDSVIKGTIAYGGSYGSPEVSFTDPTFLKVLRSLSPLSDGELQAWLDALAAVPAAEWRTSPDLPEVLRQFASNMPLAWLDGNEPPFLIVHGELDEIAPAAEAQVFAQAVQAVGVPATLAILPGMYHRVNEAALHEPLFAFLSQLTTSSP